MNTSKIVLKGAVMNCGLATAVINTIICYFTLAKVAEFAFSELGGNFMGLAIGCGILCPLFGGLTLKPLQEKQGLQFADKSSYLLPRVVPNNLILGIAMIGLLSFVLFWWLPGFLVNMVAANVVLNRLVACVVLGVYSGFVATFAAYLGIYRAYYARAAK